MLLQPAAPRPWALLAALLLACNGDDAGGTDSSSTSATSTSATSTTDAATTTDTTDTAATTAAETDTDATTDTGVEAPSYAEVNEVLGAAGCTNGYCHGNGAGQLMLTGDPALDHANLVNTSGAQPACGQKTLVVPGDPDASILWLRVRPVALDSDPPCVAKMPQGSDGLSDADAAVIRDWILGGALL